MTNLISQIKPGQKILLRDGYSENIWTAYGLKKGRFGYSLRVKLYKEDGGVEFSAVSTVETQDKNTAIRPIGAFVA